MVCPWRTALTFIDLETVMHNKLALLLIVGTLHGGALAFQIDCPDPKSKAVERDLSNVVGYAVLYPMDSSAFEQSVSCLLGIYSRTDVAVAGLKWDLAHALLRIMATDPIQFFNVAGRQEPISVDRWLQSLDHAALWPRERCPRPDPMSLARRSIENLKLDRPKEEALRKQVVRLLEKWPCRVAN